ncbi:hypothetical protein Hanom_Chr01g00061541 [Helianthus anomalus]
MTMARRGRRRVGFLNLQPHFCSLLIIDNLSRTPFFFRDTLCFDVVGFLSPLVDDDNNISETPPEFAISGCIRFLRKNVL